MLSGALRPDAGSIGVNGVDMLAKPRVARRLVGVVPQGIALCPTLSAEQNLRFFTGVYRIPRKERAERVAWALDVVGLSDRAKDRVSTFSGGMKRRVNIAAGMPHRPRLLFLDGPTVGVDAQSRNAIFDTVLRLRAELDMSVVYTSHYMNEVERLCDRVVIIDHGRSIANGSQEELLAAAGCRRGGVAPDRCRPRPGRRRSRPARRAVLHARRRARDHDHRRGRRAAYAGQRPPPRVGARAGGVRPARPEPDRCAYCPPRPGNPLPRPDRPRSTGR